MFNMKEFNSGVAVMDAHDPEWFWAVNPDTLDMRDWEYCVLGQYFGSFSDGVAALGVSDYSGFDVPGRPEDYVKLTEAWRDLIVDRRNNA